MQRPRLRGNRRRLRPVQTRELACESGRSRVREVAPRLIHRRVTGVEAVARGAEVEPPHADPLVAREPAGLVEPVVEPGGPLPQGPRVVLPEPLDVLDGEPG